MDTQQKAKKNRSIQLLLSCGFLLTLFASVVGGFILAVGYTKAPTATQPIWKLGQWMLFFGLVNLSIYTGLYFCIRRLSRDLSRSA
jgi:hypothetical protein